MKPRNYQEEQERQVKAMTALKRHGFTALGNWRFSKAGVIYELSAADLSQIERIESDGLFVEAPCKTI